MRLRMCPQGAFGAGEGLEVQSTPTGGTWTDIVRIPGTPYAAALTVGAVVTDADGVDHAVVQDGGWIDVNVDIPDDADEVRLQEFWDAGSSSQHDIALWSVQLRND